MYCTRCGMKLREDANFCTFCGFRTVKRMTPPNRIQPSAEQKKEEEAGWESFGIVSLVLGILGIAAGGIPFVGLAFGILALTLSVKTMKMIPAGRRGVAIAGFVLGILAIALGCYAAAFFLAGNTGYPLQITDLNLQTM